MNKSIWKGLIRTGFLFALLLAFNTANAQGKYAIKGVVTDSAGAGLPSATVIVLEKDSTISSFTTTGEDGTFRIPHIMAGEYIVQISYMGYLSKDKNITFKKGGDLEKDLGKVRLEIKKNELGEFEVTADAPPIVLKEDTVEYNADAFQTAPDAKVEDLLKQLPGVEVDKDGNIKAQGEDVEKVLVDGKEFFGDDPKMATKNLPANAIDKVQVFDKKSEFSEFTGFDDGERSKTINLTLKKDKKKGYFGNIAAGYGTEDRYEARANINRFAQKYQLSGIGSLNNTNQQGFSWDDYINFMGGFSNLRNAGSLPVGFGMSDGFMTAGGAGLNYNFFPNKKVDINTSYFYNGIEHEMLRESYRETYLDTGTFVNNDTSDQLNNSAGHKLNFYTRIKPDSLQDISFRGAGNFSLNKSVSTSSQQTIGTDGRLSNTIGNDYDTKANNYGGNVTTAYRRKFARKGRALAIEARGNYGVNDRDDDLFSENVYYANNIVSRRDSVLQDQLTDQLDYSYDVEATWIEPVGKREFLKFDIDHHGDLTDYAKNFYDRYPGSDPENVFNDSLSNSLNKNYDYDRGVLTFRLVRDKMQLTVGGAYQYSRLNGDLGDEQTVYREFKNVLPTVQWRYEFSRMSRLNINYRTSVSAPSIEQLRPTVDNSNPQNIYIGNPNLNAEERHRVNVGYMNYSQFTFTSVFANVSFVYTKDKIRNSQVTNSEFVQTTTPVNVDNDITVNGFVGFNTPFKPLKIKFNAHINGMYSRGITPVNGVDNITNRVINTYDFSISNYFKEDIVDAEVGIALNTNDITYSIDEQNNQNYLNTTYTASLDIYFLKKWTIESELNYEIFGDQGQGTQEVPILKAGLSRSILKNDQGRIRVSGFDLLNRNLGFNRTNQLNYFQEERIPSLGRFFMLTFSYNFTMVGK